MADARIGDVENLDLVLRRNADTAFSVEWWGEVDHTSPIAVGEAHGQVRDSDLEDALLILDLDPFITVAGNVVYVQVPASAVAALDALEGGSWDLVVHATTGEKRAVLEGTATIVRGATR